MKKGEGIFPVGARGGCLKQCWKAEQGQREPLCGHRRVRRRLLLEKKRRGGCLLQDTEKTALFPNSNTAKCEEISRKEFTKEEEENC